jgi:small subunit ribosomal protein S2
VEGTTESISSVAQESNSSDVDKTPKPVVSPEAKDAGAAAASTPTPNVEEAAPSGRVERIPAEYRELTPREPVEINLRTLLEAGVHFGHQTARWNPKMAPYIHGSRNGIHIVNLPKTVTSWQVAREAIKQVAARGGSVLFVGTKKQAQDPIVEEARRSGSYYVSRRWLGGMLTNFQTIRKSIARMNKLEEILAEEEKLNEEGSSFRFTKKERLMMSRERDKLYFSLGGIREMYSIPQLMFVVDIKREDIAIKEAQRLDIPVIALVDTNCNPGVVQHAIPSNDDGTRAIRLFCSAVADAIAEGKKVFAERGPANKAEATVSSSRRGGGKRAQGAKPKGDGAKKAKAGRADSSEKKAAAPEKKAATSEDKPKVEAAKTEAEAKTPEAENASDVSAS